MPRGAERNIVRHAGVGLLEMTALKALAVTKMDWNNDALYDPAAVTIRYSQRLGCIEMLSRPCLSRRRLRRCPEAF